MKLLDQLLALAARDLVTHPGKVHLLRKTMKHIGRLKDPIEKEHYIQRVAEMVDRPAGAIRRVVSVKAAGE
jgi:hypothetical protein